MLRALALVISLLFVPTVATAQPKAGPGTTVVKQANDNLSSLLKQKAAPAKVTASVRDFLDIDELGKAALVDHWKTLKPAEQTDFLKLLRELIEANYVKTQNANVNYSIDYLGESSDSQGNIVVNTKINTQRKGRPFTITVDYVLRKQGNAYRAFDVKTDGVGLVENYRAQFNKMIKDKGFAAVLESMKKKAASLQQAAQAPAKS
jgi:phospholipid transport system substrate-binding protein